MRRWLPVCLIALGLLLCAPMLHAIILLVQGGTPDASAISMQTLLIVRTGIGLALILTGLIWLIVRRSPKTI